MKLKHFLFIIFILFLQNCAQLHHVQIGEIENHPDYIKKPFDIKISETGVSLQDAVQISKALSNEKTGKQVEEIANIIAMFQMGPRTGNPVYVKDYAKNLIQVIYEKCPSGKITGLTSVRESRKYPVISGEIVKVTGYCLLPKNNLSKN